MYKTIKTQIEFCLDLDMEFNLNMLLDGKFEYGEDYVFDISGTVEQAEPATETYPGSQADIVDINVKYEHTGKFGRGRSVTDVTEIFVGTDYWELIRDKLWDEVPDDEPDTRDWDAERAGK